MLPLASVVKFIITSGSWAVFFCILSFESQGGVYRALFPNGQLIYFEPERNRSTHPLPLNPLWFRIYMGVHLLEEDIHSLPKWTKPKVINISGGTASAVMLRSSDMRFGGSLERTVQYALEIAVAALGCPGFDRIFDKPVSFNPRTERRLFIAIDVHNPDQMSNIMHRAAQLSDSLVSKRSVLRWEPNMRHVWLINQVTLSLVIPTLTNQPTSTAVDDRIFAIIRLFLDEFDYHTISFEDTSAPHISSMSRHKRPAPKVPPEKFVDHLIESLRRHNVIKSGYNAYKMPIKPEHIEQLLVSLTVKDSEEGLFFLVNAIKKLNLFLRTHNVVYLLQLRRVERLPEFYGAYPVTGGDYQAAAARVIFQLSHFLPPLSVITTPSSVAMRTLNANELVRCIFGAHDDRVQLSHWYPIRLSRASLKTKNSAAREILTYFKHCCLPCKVRQP